MARGRPRGLREALPARGRRRRRRAGPGHAFDVSPAARLDLAAVRGRPRPRRRDRGGARRPRGRRHGAPDPHFWLDPLRYADVGDAIAAELAARDTANAAAYRANAKAFRAALDARWTSEFTTGLASCAVDDLVTSHAAFGYLAEAYGFTQESDHRPDPDAEPSPAAMAELTAPHPGDAGRRPCMPRRSSSEDVAKTLARETGARLAVLDPIEGITSASAGRDYPTVMRANLAILRAGQECSMTTAATTRRRPDHRAARAAFGYADHPVVAGATLDRPPRRGRGRPGAQRLGQVHAGPGAARAQRPPRRRGRAVRAAARPFTDFARLGLRPAAAHPLGVGPRDRHGDRRSRPARPPPVVATCRPPAQDAAIIDRALDVVGLTDRADADVATLSGGQQRRVLIARALAVQPRRPADGRADGRGGHRQPAGPRRTVLAPARRPWHDDGHRHPRARPRWPASSPASSSCRVGTSPSTGRATSSLHATGEFATSADHHHHDDEDRATRPRLPGAPPPARSTRAEVPVDERAAVPRLHAAGAAWPPSSSASPHPLVGVFLVQRRLSLIGDGMGHVALAGVAVGVLTGQAPVLTALVAAVAAAIAIELIRGAGPHAAATSPSP